MSGHSSLTSIHVATCNIRFDGQRNNPIPIPAQGAIPPSVAPPEADVYRELPWAQRRSRLVDALLSTGELDILGFQEVYKNQLQDLSKLLGSGYDHVGVGRDDGLEAGEYSPIFWNSERFSMVDWKTIWLSTTPDRAGSIGWDARQTRIATLLTLRSTKSSHLKHGDLVHVVNTHYDDGGVQARSHSSLLIREKIKQWVEQIESAPDMLGDNESPVILMGDFNSPANEDGYKNIISSHALPNGKASFSFIDSFTALKTRKEDGKHPSITGGQSTPYGPINTYTGFTKPGLTSTERIDFIMLGASEEPSLPRLSPARGNWVFKQYACIDNWIEEGDVDGWQGRWSDHRAVRVTISR